MRNPASARKLEIQVGTSTKTIDRKIYLKPSIVDTWFGLYTIRYLLTGINRKFRAEY